MRLIRFTDASSNLLPLKPGHNWVLIFPAGSVVYEKQSGSGIWTAVFHSLLIP